MGPQAKAGNSELTEAGSQPLKVWTVGHSTRTLDEFTAVLQAYGIGAVADVRRFPGSRRHPQFGAEALTEGLGKAGIETCWLPSLGGRRAPAKDSPESAWRVHAFRGYADHTATDEFAAGLFELVMLAGGMRTAIMCAELLWWRCHRRLISDVLVFLGADVIHIRDGRLSEPHSIAPPARVAAGILTWAPESKSYKSQTGRSETPI